MKPPPNDLDVALSRMGAALHRKRALEFTFHRLPYREGSDMDHAENRVEAFPQTDLGSAAAVVVANVAQSRDMMVERDRQAMAPMSEAGAMLAMIERAARDPSVDIEKFERLMAMSERADAMRERAENRAAEIAFAAAVSSAKGEIEPITRNASGHNDKKYADFGAIARAIDPVLARNGLSYRFRANQADKITVTCIISHVSGHQEENTLSGSADVSGSKNAIQAIGSTLTYLQRYTLVLALGLATSNDDDGRAAAGKSMQFISEEQEMEIRDILESYEANEASFCKAIKVTRLAEIPANKFATFVDLIHQRKAQK